MLQNLHVKNLALIDEIELELGKGLNIITGETGAGKSLIIDSVNLSLGQRADKSIIKEGAESAFAELTFSVNDTVMEAVKEQDIECEEENIFLSRRVTGDKSVAKINGESVPASKLKLIGSLLIDLYGQNEHESLMTPAKHMQFLDDYAGDVCEKEKNKYKKLYAEYRALLKELNEALTKETGKDKELDFLRFEAEEISNANLKHGEDIELEDRFKLLNNSKKIVNSLGVALSCCDDDGALSMIERAIREISSVAEYDEKISSMCNALVDAEAIVSDFVREVKNYADSLSFDDESFHEMSERLNEINRLKQKYGGTVEHVLKALDERNEKIEKLENYEVYLNKLKKDTENALFKAKEEADKLSEIRKKAAKKLDEEMVESLKELNFLDVKFECGFSDLSELSANGSDSMEFNISLNPGAPLKPLKDVASGGELSRIMLALKSLLANKGDVETLIFDEIDTGISGRTAELVAERLLKLSKDNQVICITHLPQIAAMADNHFFIEKNVTGDETITRVYKLDHESQIKELARMLGGVKITDAVLENAKEMKALADSLK